MHFEGDSKRITIEGSTCSCSAKFFLRPSGIEAKQLDAALPLLVSGQILPLHVLGELQPLAFGFRDRIVDDFHFQLGHADEEAGPIPPFPGDDRPVRQAHQRLKLADFQAFAELPQFLLIEPLSRLWLGFEPAHRLFLTTCTMSLNS